MSVEKDTTQALLNALPFDYATGSELHKTGPVSAVVLPGFMAYRMTPARCLLHDHVPTAYLRSKRAGRNWKPIDGVQVAEFCTLWRQLTECEHLILVGHSAGTRPLFLASVLADVDLVVHYAGPWGGDIYRGHCLFLYGANDRFAPMSQQTQAAAYMHRTDAVELKAGHLFHPSATELILQEMDLLQGGDI